MFLYNPASLQLTQKLARNLMRSIKEHPREVWILYVTPYDIFDTEKSLETIKTGEYEFGNHPSRLYRTHL